MWRKQDQPKPSGAPEAAVTPAVEAQTPIPSKAPEAIAQKPAVVLPSSRLTGSLRVKGEINGNEDLLIDARVDGAVHLVGATALIGPNGQVTANITATQIVVEGNLEGNLLAGERVRIGATGKTKGSIRARRISVEGGAEIHGAVEMLRGEEFVPRPIIPSAAPKSEDVAVPKPVPAATSLAKEPSAAA